MRKEGDQIVCIRHGARFRIRIRIGLAFSAPADASTRSSPLRIENGEILTLDSRNAICTLIIKPAL